jgi:hypothetical protein
MLKHMKQKLIELQGQIGESSVILEDCKALLSEVGRSSDRGFSYHA